jgi:hypothetical protein
VPSQFKIKTTSEDVYAIFLSAYYCNNVNDYLSPRIELLIQLKIELLQHLTNMLQPDEYLRLLQWMLRTVYPITLRTFLAEPPSENLRPSFCKLLDLLEANQAYLSHKGRALVLLLKFYDLSASEFLSAMERFSQHWPLVHALWHHPRANSLTSAELLGSLQDARSSGNTRHITNLSMLPSARALSAAGLISIR